MAPSTTCFTAFSAVSDTDTCQDGAGHGTHVGGIVAALNNTIDVVGVAPGATLYAVKMLDDSGSGTDATVIAGLNWVLANANNVTPPIRALNMSLGRPASPDDSAMQAAITAVHAAGIAIVTSAGNDPNVEATDNVPAKFAEVMAIASTTAVDGEPRKCGRRTVRVKADTASYFTTDGPTITVSAPGERQEDILNGCFLSSVGIESLAVGGGTTEKFGTSMSAPHVTAVVALMWDKADDTPGGTLDPEDARARIQDGADRVGNAPVHSPSAAYTFDGVKEGILSAPGALASSATAP